MKRLWVWILVLTLIGCSASPVEKPAAFYYPPEDYIHTQDGSILDFEIRETVSAPNMASVLDLYMEGPQSTRFLNPFPEGCRVISFRDYGSSVDLVISNELAQLTGISLPLACASLAKTCMELTGAEKVSIRAESQLLGGSKEVVMTRDTLNISSNTFSENTQEES